MISGGNDMATRGTSYVHIIAWIFDSTDVPVVHSLNSPPHHDENGVMQGKPENRHDASLVLSGAISDSKIGLMATLCIQCILHPTDRCGNKWRSRDWKHVQLQEQRVYTHFQYHIKIKNAERLSWNVYICKTLSWCNGKLHSPYATFSINMTH